MTMPLLINSTQNRELQSALNKGYSEISQALEFMKIDTGTDIAPQDYPAYTFAPVYSKYFKSIKYSLHDGIISGEHEDGDNETSPVKVYKNYKTYSLSQTVKTDIFDDGQFLLNDGALVMIENPNFYPRRIFISIDINGMNKKPNVYGRDLFTFEITSEGKLLPMGAEGTTYTNTDKYCSKNSNDRLNGIACAAKALSDPDYFKKMY